MQIKFIDRKTGEVKIENPPAEGLLKFLYDNPFGKTAILPMAKRKFISEIYGRKMNKPSSTKKIQGFVDKLNIEMDDYEKSISEFHSFNDFFYRKLKANARPIEKGFVSPGDGRLLAFEDVGALNEFYIKGRPFTLPEFLDNDALAEEHQNSSIFILRLAPNDYHRFHFPASGKPSNSTKIKGKHLSVSPYALASHFTKVFCENKREYSILSSKIYGDVIIAPIGSTMVGSIINTYTPHQKVQKGSEMGYFAFGGSTVVVIVNKGKLKIDQDILDNTQNQMETFVRMGEKIGE